MPLKSTTERLEEVQAAITAVLLSQSYTLGGRQITRANLDELLVLEKHLEAKLNVESGAKSRILGVPFNGLC